MFKRGGGWRMEVQGEVGGTPRGLVGHAAVSRASPKTRQILWNQGGVGRQEKGKGQALK